MKKKATVFSNDPQRPQLLLTVAGSVEPFADIHPERIILRGYPGQTLRQELVITPRAAYPFAVTDVTAKYGQHIKFELRKEQTAEGLTYVVVVENTRTTPGKYYDTLLMGTDSPLKPKIPVHVYGTIGAGPKEETPPS